MTTVVSVQSSVVSKKATMQKIFDVILWPDRGIWVNKNPHTRHACKLKITFCSLLIALCCSIGVANAATCDAGYYLSNGRCITCNDVVLHKEVAYGYCPGDDTRYECPKKTWGWEVYYKDYNDIYLFAVYKVPRTKSLTAKNITECYYNFKVADDHNSIFAEAFYSDSQNAYIIQEYYNDPITGAVEIYGCDSRSTKNYICTGIRDCTNMPPNSHYANMPGVSGTALTPRDCWECDAGYGHTSDGRCLPLCRIGETAMNGINIYAEKHTKYAMAVPRNGATCWISAVKMQGGKLVPTN